MVLVRIHHEKLRADFQYSLCRVVLMVVGCKKLDEIVLVFQYSLCRVVLMVFGQLVEQVDASLFQYSLCRVVLMVCYPSAESTLTKSLSVLALSSRFDGPG